MGEHHTGVVERNEKREMSRIMAGLRRREAPWPVRDR